MTASSDDPNGPRAALPSAIEPFLEPTDYTQYLLHAKSEILFVLRGLLNNADHLTAYFNEGRDFFLTTLIAVGNDEITLDCGGNTDLNRRAVTAEKIFCVARHEKVRIQFQLRGMREATVEGRPAFRAALPEALLRLQRREYYRLTTPVARPLKCQIPLPSADGGSASTMTINVIDISGGGLAVMAPPPEIALSRGDTFPNCRVELPEVGVLMATLQIRSIFEVTLRSGAQVTRAGCQFVDLPGPMLTLVQRYIIKVERERKARESGMA
jgi:c-di-GMP-binding flagellar brake protein YcgR